MSEEFWGSAEGISSRISMLAENIVYGTYNNSIKITTKGLGGIQLQVMGPDDEKTCAYCQRYVGKVYQTHWFMPDLPAHPNCRHSWDLYIPEG